MSSVYMYVCMYVCMCTLIHIIYACTKCVYETCVCVPFGMNAHVPLRMLCTYTLTSTYRNYKHTHTEVSHTAQSYIPPDMNDWMPSVFSMRRQEVALPPKNHPDLIMESSATKNCLHKDKSCGKSNSRISNSALGSSSFPIPFCLGLWG